MEIPECGSCIELDDLRYHESWDWLMSVVEKIENSVTPIGESIEFGSEGIHIDIIIDHDCCRIVDEDRAGYYDKTSYVKGSKIDAVLEAVTEFIKWYNAQNASNTSEPNSEPNVSVSQSSLSCSL